MTTARSTKEVLCSQLHEGKFGTVDEDIPRNYAEDVVIWSGYGVHLGHEGMRAMARQLRRQLPNMRFAYHTVQIVGEFGFLEWTAEADCARVDDGADSYVIRDGGIAAQSIHDTVQPGG